MKTFTASGTGTTSTRLKLGFNSLKKENSTGSAQKILHSRLKMFKGNNDLNNSHMSGIHPFHTAENSFQYDSEVRYLIIFYYS